MRMVRPVPVFVSMHLARPWQFLRRVSTLTRDVMRVVVPAPPVLGIEVCHQQALAMMPARAKDIIVFLTLGRTFFLAQAIPFAMGMFLNPLGHKLSGNCAIARGFEKEAEVNIHQAIKAEFLVNPTNFRQQLAPESHQVSLYRVDIWTRRLTKFAQVIGNQPIWSSDPYTGVSKHLL